MSIAAVRRIVVGVDGSAESAAALRWACREASLREAEVHAVHAWEAPCHGVASYAVPVQARARPDRAESDFGHLWQSVLPEGVHAMPDVPVRTEVVPGLAARVLLERCAGADMLVLGTAGDAAGSPSSAGPVIRACLRRAVCPVVVISVERAPLAEPDQTEPDQPEPGQAEPDQSQAVQPGAVHPGGLQVPVQATGGASAEPASVPACVRG